jgi:hypothetical protein
VRGHTFVFLFLVGWCCVGWRPPSLWMEWVKCDRGFHTEFASIASTRRFDNFGPPVDLLDYRGFIRWQKHFGLFSNGTDFVHLRSRNSPSFKNIWLNKRNSFDNSKENKAKKCNCSRTKKDRWLCVREWLCKISCMLSRRRARKITMAARYTRTLKRGKISRECWSHWRTRGTKQSLAGSTSIKTSVRFVRWLRTATFPSALIRAGPSPSYW